MGTRPTDDPERTAELTFRAFFATRKFTTKTKNDDRRRERLATVFVERNVRKRTFTGIAADMGLGAQYVRQLHSFAESIVMREIERGRLHRSWAPYTEPRWSEYQEWLAKERERGVRI